ncbi:MAG: DUF968 domain-containing protein [Rhizobiaceae bacterium]|nr:DUF968 domain-containing protein [Rhizobiaceae bacterium]
MALQIRKVSDPYFAKAKPQKSKPYLHWLHALPCCLTGRYGVEAAHVSYARPWFGHLGRAKGHKAHDLFAVPLHPDMHALQHSGKMGSEEEFWSRHGVDPHELAVTLWAIYSAYPEPESTARATARINQGLAVAGRLPQRDFA